MNKNSHTNTISLCAPHRHDLVNWLFVNIDVKNFYRKLVKLLNIFQYVIVATIVLSREICDLFTEWCLHVKSLGKEKSSKPVTSSVLAVLRKTPIPICLHWKSNNDDDDEGDGEDD